MSPQLLFQLIPWLTVALISTTTVAAEFNRTKPWCNATCGNFRIPYPFGMDEEQKGCYHVGSDYDYSINCTQVMEVNLTSPSYAIWKLQAYQKQRFGFNAIGCRISKGQNYTVDDECKTACVGRDNLTDDTCSGSNGCCQTTVPKRLQRSLLTVSNSSGKEVSPYEPCSYAFLAEEGHYKFSMFDLRRNNKHFLKKTIDIPIVPDWVIGNKSCDEAQKDFATFACKENSYCNNSDNGPSYLCYCNPGYHGNP